MKQEIIRPAAKTGLCLRTKHQLFCHQCERRLVIILPKISALIFQPRENWGEKELKLLRERSAVTVCNFFEASAETSDENISRQKLFPGSGISISYGCLYLQICDGLEVGNPYEISPESAGSLCSSILVD